MNRRRPAVPAIHRLGSLAFLFVRPATASRSDEVVVATNQSGAVQCISKAVGAIF